MPATPGTPQWWLAQFGFTNEFDQAEEDDDDLDGVPTADEYVAGTIPTNRLSVFRIVGQGRQSGSNFIQWIGGTSGPTNPYGIYVSTNLQQGIWSMTGRVQRLDGTNTLWLILPTQTPAFYRITATN